MGSVEGKLLRGNLGGAILAEGKPEPSDITWTVVEDEEPG